MNNSIVGAHAIWPQKNDPIFEVAAQAKAAKAELGKDNVIDSTIGVLVDDDGNLICLPTVFGVLRDLPNYVMAEYAQISGEKEFLEAVEKACFRAERPDAFIRSCATPGGSGAVRNTIFNYTDPGDKILVSDWHWHPYQVMAEEFGRSVTTYTLFDENNNFNFDAFKAEFTKLVDSQQRILTILNTPAQNPTGYSLSIEEWNLVLGVMKEAAKDTSKKVVILVDGAYMDYAGDGVSERKFFKLFENLPENMLVSVAFSMSKGFTMYGFRCGAAICIAPTEEAANEFFYANMHSARASWSSVNKGPMEVMKAIYSDPAKLKAYEDERNSTRDMLKKRAAAFVEAAKECELETIPYIDGFFICIEHKKPFDLAELLKKEQLYVVPMGMGIRFALCSTPEEQCRKAPAIIKRALDSMGK